MSRAATWRSLPRGARPARGPLRGDGGARAARRGHPRVFSAAARCAISDAIVLRSPPARKSHVAPIAPRTNPTRQDRLPDGALRQGADLPRARRAIEPGRARVPLARPSPRRPHRAADGEPAGVHGDLLGGAAQRPVLHADQRLPDPRRDRVHRGRLRRARRDHVGASTATCWPGWSPRRTVRRCSTRSTNPSRGFARGRTRSRRSRTPRSPIRSPARTCCTRRGPPAGPRASSTTPCRSRSISPTRSCATCARTCAACPRTASTCPRRRSTTRRRCAST